jgi:hypothetical protein
LTDTVGALDQEERQERHQELQDLLLQVELDIPSPSPAVGPAPSPAVAPPSPPLPGSNTKGSLPSGETGRCDVVREHRAYTPWCREPTEDIPSSLSDDDHIPSSWSSVGGHTAWREPAACQPDAAAHNEPPAQPGREEKTPHFSDTLSSLLGSIRPSGDPAELHATISQLAVSLRSSELQRRHLGLQVKALSLEQGRLQGEVQTLARRDRELEEELLLLRLRHSDGGHGGAPSVSALPLLRGQMLEAARAEAEAARREAAAAKREQARAVEEVGAVRAEAEAARAALTEEVSRLTGQLAQRAVLYMAQVR